MLFDKQLRRKLSQLSRKQATDHTGDADADRPDPAPPPEAPAPLPPPTPRRVGLDDISKLLIRLVDPNDTTTHRFPYFLHNQLNLAHNRTTDTLYSHLQPPRDPRPSHHTHPIYKTDWKAHPSLHTIPGE